MADGDEKGNEHEEQDTDSSGLVQGLEACNRTDHSKRSVSTTCRGETLSDTAHCATCSDSMSVTKVSGTSFVARNESVPRFRASVYGGSQ